MTRLNLDQLEDYAASTNRRNLLLPPAQLLALVKQVRYLQTQLDVFIDQTNGYEKPEASLLDMRELNTQMSRARAQLWEIERECGLSETPFQPK